MDFCNENDNHDSILQSLRASSQMKIVGFEIQVGIWYVRNVIETLQVYCPRFPNLDNMYIKYNSTAELAISYDKKIWLKG